MKRVFLILCSLIHFGCGSSQPGSAMDSYVLDSSSSGLPGTTAPTGVAVTTAQLAGSWLSTCASNASLGRSGTNLVTFSGSSMTQTVTNYPNLYCSGASDWVTQMSGSYSIGSLSSTVSNATQWTGNISQILMRPMTADAASSANSQGYCGYSDWAVNVSKSITAGSPCLNGLAVNFADLVSVSGSQLYFGNDAVTALDTSSPYTRQ